MATKTTGKPYRADEIRTGDQVILPGQPKRLVIQAKTTGNVTRFTYSRGYSETAPTALVRAVRPKARTINHDAPTLVHRSESKSA